MKTKKEFIMANVTFHVGSTTPPTTGLTTGGLYVNNTDGGIWYATGEDSRTEVGSWVTFTQSLTSGTKLGTIKINGNAKDLYCRNTLNTAGGTATNEKLFFVGMKSDNVASAQTYTNSYCYALDSHLYSNGFKCANICYADIGITIPHSGNSALPVAKGDAESYYTNVSEVELNGAFIGYEYQSLNSGYGSGSWRPTRLGVQVGTTDSGGTATYKIGVKLTANSSLTNNVQETLQEGSVTLRVYYIPF